MARRITRDDVQRMLKEGGYYTRRNFVPLPRDKLLLHALQAAAGGGFEDLVREILAAGADVSRAGDAMIAAAANDHVDVLACLIEADVDVDTRGGECGETALMAAAGGGALDAVRFLLELGANRNLRDRDTDCSAWEWADSALRDCFRRKKFKRPAEDYRAVMDLLGCPFD